MWCTAAGIKPRDALGLARALGALISSRKRNVPSIDLLNFAEKRSLERFLRRGGSVMSNAADVTVRDFLNHQQFVRHPVIVADLLRLFAD